uniref:Peptidase A2 domain-containing protein n=1 Tax=Alexandrium monilatum TaxID=311494 RepID=A0A7S4PZC8_9DINO
MGSGIGHMLAGETELERERRVYRKFANAKPGSLPHLLLKLAGCMGCMLPMAPPGGELPFVACRLGGHEAEMLVDTGAKRSVISSSLARELGLSRHTLVGPDPAVHRDPQLRLESLRSRLARVPALGPDGPGHLCWSRPGGDGRAGASGASLPGAGVPQHRFLGAGGRGGHAGAGFGSPAPTPLPR